MSKFPWVKNGPDVEKPEGDCIIRIGRGVYYFARYRKQSRFWVAGDYNTADTLVTDKGVTHFAVITEPDDG